MGEGKMLFKGEKEKKVLLHNYLEPMSIETND
jgi:hypothetical protein